MLSATGVRGLFTLQLPTWTVNVCTHTHLCAHTLLRKALAKGKEMEVNRYLCPVLEMTGIYKCPSALEPGHPISVSQKAVLFWKLREYLLPAFLLVFDDLLASLQKSLAVVASYHLLSASVDGVLCVCLPYRVFFKDPVKLYE